MFPNVKSPVWKLNQFGTWTFTVCPFLRHQHLKNEWNIWEVKTVHKSERNDNSSNFLVGKLQHWIKIKNCQEIKLFTRSPLSGCSGSGSLIRETRAWITCSNSKIESITVQTYIRQYIQMMKKLFLAKSKHSFLPSWKMQTNNKYSINWNTTKCYACEILKHSKILCVCYENSQIYAESRTF